MAPVTVWVYDGSLKVEHQAVTVSQYSVELQDDRKHLSAVNNPRLVEPTSVLLSCGSLIWVTMSGCCTGAHPTLRPLAPDAPFLTSCSRCHFTFPISPSPSNPPPPPCPPPPLPIP